MSGRKARKGSQSRSLSQAQEGGAARGSRGRPRWSADFRDKIAVLIAAVILVPLVVATFFTFYRSDQSDEPSAAPTPAGSAREPRAAIVDQLSLTEPDPAFVETATRQLEQAGYAVDYYPGEEVTVEFYRNLATLGHALVIFRVHSALGRNGDRAADWVTLFTADAFDETRYPEEGVKRTLSRVSYYEDSPPYFGIMPGFIKSSMLGNFADAIVIFMGCDGLKSATLAEAFVEKGARTVVAWDGLVSSSHTDAATERLLQHLLVDGLTVGGAVAQTMAEVGPDPAYGSSIQLYPPEGVASGP